MKRYLLLLFLTIVFACSLPKWSRSSFGEIKNKVSQSLLAINSKAAPHCCCHCSKTSFHGCNQCCMKTSSNTTTEADKCSAPVIFFNSTIEKSVLSQDYNQKYKLQKIIHYALPDSPALYPLRI